MMTSLSSTKPEKAYQVGEHKITCSQMIDIYESLHGRSISRASAWRRINSGCTYEDLFKKSWQNTNLIETKERMGTKIQLEQERRERNNFFKTFNKAFSV